MTYQLVKSLSGTPETNVTRCVNSAEVTKKKRKERKEGGGGGEIYQAPYAQPLTNQIPLNAQ